MPSEYASKFGPAIAGLIAQKRAMGYPYDTSAAILGRFDAFAASKFPGEESLTKDLCMAWATMREGEHQNTLLRRVTPVIMPGFIQQLQAWHDEFMAGRPADVNNIAAWAYTAIDDYIRKEENKCFVQAEEIMEPSPVPTAAAAEAEPEMESFG